MATTLFEEKLEHSATRKGGSTARVHLTQAAALTRPTVSTLMVAESGYSVSALGIWIMGKFNLY